MDTFNSAPPRKSGHTESIIKEIKRRTRRRFNPEEKIRIVIDGLKGEASIAEICRKEGIHPQTQGKIERYHRSMKNVILLDNYYAPSVQDKRAHDAQKEAGLFDVGVSNYAAPGPIGLWYDIMALNHRQATSKKKPQVVHNRLKTYNHETLGLFA